ncbi:hypothetical protein KKB44_02655 [Candidatus Micrarchaeota archaeon]|nr:hypothetical protein [Candidatus Micrarchaeota archaeon]
MKICIACQKNIEGMKAVRVKEDRIIKTIRSIKTLLRIAQMNELYVCESDLPEHKNRRRSFEKSILFASVLAGLLVVVVLVALILSGRFDVWAIISAFIIGTFVLALPLFKYTPSVEETLTRAAPKIAVPPPHLITPAMKKEATILPKKKAKKKSTRKR